MTSTVELTLPKHVRQIVERVADACKPQRVLLFGSYAMGTSHPFSDVDLLVIKDTPIPIERRGRELRQLFYRSVIRVDLLFYTPAELADAERCREPFVCSILGEARDVYWR